ncbi:MAG TPA: hypothetical protein VF173_32880 [Thermoanaerobaculia bacterium]|nr:hypothetical protein [Thermoanaerobaculia bacterium]
MNSLVLFTLLALARPQGSTAPPVRPQNVVRICSLATGTGCQELDARLLEPTSASAKGTAGGLRAFVDPGTKSLVQPNRDQIDELGLAISESMAQRGVEPKLQVMPNGTLRVSGDTLKVFFTATVKPQSQETKP